MDRKEILKEVSSLDPTKAYQESDTQTKIITGKGFIISEVLHFLFNASVNEGSFQSVFELTTDVTLIFKEGPKNSKDNYRPISILKYL